MSWKTPILDKTFKADGAIAAYTAVTPGSDQDHVATAGAADIVIGVTGQVGAAAAEDPVDVTMLGIAEIELAGTLAAGALVASDASGNAVAAADTNPTIGRLVHGGVDGDVVPVFLNFGTASLT
jgi:hypothetical protein